LPHTNFGERRQGDVPERAMGEIQAL